MVAEVMATDLQGAGILESRVQQVKDAFNELGREQDRWPTVSEVIAKVKRPQPIKNFTDSPVLPEGIATIETAKKYIQEMKDKGHCGLSEKIVVENEDELLSEAKDAFKSINERQA